jgi:hypothetical protein
MALIAIFVASVVALLWAHEDPFAREAVCAHTGFCPVIPNAWYKTIYDFAVGSLISLFFYLLVVRLPEYERRQRLKRSLERHYRDFKEECIEIMLMVADGGYSGELPETLIEQDKFRQYFTEKVMPGQNRWDLFLNKLDEYQLCELRSRMDIFEQSLSLS